MRPPSPLARRVTAAALAGLLAAPSAAVVTALPAALAVTALLATAAGLGHADRRRGLALLAVGGTAAAALFLVDLSAWIRVAAGLVAAVGCAAALPEWQGEARRAREVWRSLVAPGLAVGVPGAVFAIALAGGQEALVSGSLAAAAPVDAPLRLGVDALLAVVAVLMSDGPRVRSVPARGLHAALTAAAVALALARVAWIASIATLPEEVAWSEAPALVDALKLAAHQPLYGPPRDLDSYAYSPLVDLVHRALLGPVNLALSLRAHRTLCLVAEGLAFAAMAWAAWPALRRVAASAALLLLALLLTTTLANLLAPSIHPDHAVLLAFGVAAAVLLGEERWPPWAWWSAVVLIAPVATLAKISGAGIGVGLAAAFALERRWKPFGAAMGSLALAAATVPLLNATAGPYGFYALHVQTTHPIVWGKLASLPATPSAVLAIGASMLVAAGRRFGGSRALPSATLRLAALTAACGVAGLPGWLKYAGRDNNLALLSVGAVLLGVLEATRTLEKAAAPALHPLLVPAAGLLGVTLLAPPVAPVLGARRDAIFAEAAMVRDTIRDDAEAGRTTLAPLHVAAWIAAGQRGVPHDRFQSAIELWFGGLPEWQGLVDHIAEGRYDTIVMMGTQLRAEPTLLGAFQERLRGAIADGYVIAGPPGVVSIESWPGAIVFRRQPGRPRGPTLLRPRGLGE